MSATTLEDGEASVGGAETLAGDAAQSTPSTEGLVSIVITTYHRNEWLAEAIESAHAQTYDPIEVVVVDGSGTEHAREVVESYEDTRYVPQTSNLGPVSDRNLGFAQSNGEYVHFLDDDDRLEPEKIARQVPVLEADPAVGVVYTGLYRQRDAKPLLPGPDARGDFLELALTMRQPPCFPSTMLIERDVLSTFMPLPEYLSGAGDTAMVIELARRTQFDFVAEPLIHRGEADESLAYTMESVEARRTLLDEYESVYDSVDERIRQTALAGSYELEGQVLLAESWWSARAIKCFALAIHHDPEPGLDRYGALAASLFGSWFWYMARDRLIALRRRRDGRQNRT